MKRNARLRPLLYLYEWSQTESSTPQQNEMNVWNTLKSWTWAQLNSPPSDQWRHLELNPVAQLKSPSIVACALDNK